MLLLIHLYHTMLSLNKISFQSDTLHRKQIQGAYFRQYKYQYLLV